MLSLGGRSFKYVLDLRKKLRLNWGMGGHSIVGPLSRDYSNIKDGRTREFTKNDVHT